MDTINCIGAYGNMLMIFKELSKRIRTKIGNARKTDGIITLEDIGTVLKDFEDFMNNNLAQYNKEVKIDFTDNVPQQDPNDVPFEITNLQNNNESKNMNKKLIRLTESDLHKIVKESVNRILKEAKYDYENQAYDEKYDGENTYLQVSMMSSPEIYIKCNNGRKPSSDYIKTYNILSSNQPEKVLDLWRKCSYESNVVTNISDERKFIVEKDADGIYLMIRVDNKEDFQRYQNGNW